LLTSIKMSDGNVDSIGTILLWIAASLLNNY
jgi:hypothetical protein